jgi:hypothetical protein
MVKTFVSCMSEHVQQKATLTTACKRQVKVKSYFRQELSCLTRLTTACKRQVKVKSYFRQELSCLTFYRLWPSTASASLLICLLQFRKSSGGCVRPCCVLNLSSVSGGCVRPCCVLNLSSVSGGCVRPCCVLNPSVVRHRFIVDHVYQQKQQQWN